LYNHNDVVHTDKEKVTGASSISFPGLNAKLSVDHPLMPEPVNGTSFSGDHSDFNFGSNAFTMEAWVKPTIEGCIIMSKWFSGTDDQGPNLKDWNSFVIWLGGPGEINTSAGANLANRLLYDGKPTIKGYFMGWMGNKGITTSTFLQGTTELTINDKWHHVAIQRSGDTLSLYVDGKLDTSVSFAGSLSHAPRWPIQIGEYNNVLQDPNGNNGYGSGQYVLPGYFVGSNHIPGTHISGAHGLREFKGFMDEIRISKGIARYAGNFTPQTSSFSNDSYTKLLIQSDYIAPTNPATSWGYYGLIDNIRVTNRARYFNLVESEGVDTYTDGHANLDILKITGSSSINRVHDADGKAIIIDESPLASEIIHAPNSDWYGNFVITAETKWLWLNPQRVQPYPPSYASLYLNHKGKTNHNFGYPVIKNSETSDSYNFEKGEWSMEMWFKPEDDPGSKNHVLLSKYKHRSDFNNGITMPASSVYDYLKPNRRTGEWMLGYSNGKLSFTFRGRVEYGGKVGEYRVIGSGGNLIVKDQWCHVLVQRVNRGNDSLIQIFKDGWLVGQKSVSKDLDFSKLGLEDHLKNPIIIGSYGTLNNSEGRLYNNYQFISSDTSFRGHIEDLRITKGLARFSSASIVPDGDFSDLSQRYVLGEDNPNIYHLQDADKYNVLLSKSKDKVGGNKDYLPSEFIDITEDEHCRVKCGGEDQRSTYWSNKNQIERAQTIVTNDFIIYRRHNPADYSAWTIRILSLNNINSEGEVACDCDNDFYDIVLDKQSKIYAFIYENDILYVYHNDPLTLGMSISVYEILPELNEQGNVYYKASSIYGPRRQIVWPIYNPMREAEDPWEAPNQYLFPSPVHGYNQVFSHKAVLPVSNNALGVTTQTHTYLYSWVLVKEGEFAGEFQIQRHAFAPDRIGSSEVYLHATKIFKARNYDNESKFQDKQHFIKGTGRFANLVFSLDDVSTTGDDQKITILKIDEKTGDLSIVSEMPVNTDKTQVSKAEIAFTFFYEGILYVSNNTAFTSDIYTFQPNGTYSHLNPADSLANNPIEKFKPGYGMLNYLFGYDFALNQNRVRTAFNKTESFVKNLEPSAFLISGSGVFSNGPQDDSALALDLEGDYTIEGNVKFDAIPSGTDDDPGATIFDFGSLKLTNTSGFFSVHMPDGDVMDYFKPQFVDKDSVEYLPNRFIHYAVQRRDSNTELWMDNYHKEVDITAFDLVAESLEDNIQDRDVITGQKFMPYNNSRSVGATTSGTNFFTGLMDDFKVWCEPVYGPTTVVTGEQPYAEGVFTSLDNRPNYIYYYYYTTLRTYTFNNPYWARYASFYYLKKITTYEGQSISMWCTAKSVVDPRYSTLQPLPITIEWWFTPAYIPAYGWGGYGIGGSSKTLIASTENPISSIGNFSFNLRRLGEIQGWGLTTSNMGYYEAVVKMGPIGRPKHQFYWKHKLTKIALNVNVWPKPPPPPKAEFAMYSCNTHSVHYPDGAPDGPALGGCTNYYGGGGRCNSTQVELGEHATILASFYPQNLPWKGYYKPSEVMPAQPITYKWKNKGRGAQSDRERKFDNAWAWPSTSVVWRDLRKGIKGPIEVEAFDDNGNSLGTVSCPGITVKLPDVLKPDVWPPSKPANSTSDYTVIDYKTTQSYRNGWWMRNHRAGQTTYDIVGKQVPSVHIDFDPIATDPNVPELQTGGLVYKWFIYGYDDGVLINETYDYAPGASQFGVDFTDNFKGTVKCYIELANYKYGETTYDPEGRRQYGKRHTVTWSINMPECYEPWMQVYNPIVGVDGLPQMDLYQMIWRLRSRGVISRAISQLSGGRELDSGEINIYYDPCTKITLPIGLLNWHDSMKKKWQWHIQTYYKRGLTKGVTFDGSVWDTALWLNHPYAYIDNYYYQALYPNFVFLEKEMYGEHNGTSTTITFNNDCGEKKLKVNFIKNGPYRVVPGAYPSGRSYRFYWRSYVRYYWYRRGWNQPWSLDHVYRTTWSWPYYHNIYSNVYYLGYCKKYRVYLDGKLVTGWQDASTVTVAGITFNVGFNCGNYTYLNYSYYYYYYYRWYTRNSCYATIRGTVDPANFPAGKKATIVFEFSSDPDKKDDWDNGKKCTFTAYIDSYAYPTIISNQYNYGWWWWGCYPYYGRYYMYRWYCPWYWYPWGYYRRYYWYPWRRVYVYYAVPSYGRTFGRGYICG
jgi:hypothetical protein